MTKTLVNLTYQAVVAEIESVLEDYPYYPYQQAFAIPDLRQELTAYVLSRISCAYGVLEEQQVRSLDYKSPHRCLEQQLQLENLIHQGIYSLLQEKSDWLTHQLPKPTQSGFEPSHWFG